MQLSKQHLKNISSKDGLELPDERLFDLPEKVLQFGTGVLLRGLPDYFIDKANRNGLFNGRIVVVKSTDTGDLDAFEKQNGLYTLCIRGLEAGKKIEETVINSSISRVLSAKEDWNRILECAHDPNMQIIISNTTEVGITLVEDDIRYYPPLSFPGKLLSFLYERYQAFDGNDASGMVIIPTELITDNGTRLRTIVFELAKRNKLNEAFIKWLDTANHFCNSLVDRIVPGKLTEQDRMSTEKKIGYIDGLMIMAEPFRLWAIESNDEKVKAILSFSEADEGVIVAPDIEKFRELKLRLLNGTHSFACGLAFLAGFSTVKDAMNDEYLYAFLQDLMMQEIVPSIVDKDINYSEATAFAAKVLDRFRNPFIDHAWMNISVQYSTKMKTRNLPLLLKHYERTSQLPEHMALGFAAFLLFMNCKKNSKEQYMGISNGTAYMVQDDQAHYFADKWHDHDAERLVETVLADTHFWDADLTKLKGFSELVKGYLKSLTQYGSMATIRRMQLNKAAV
jgi:tagaturonate reductase